MGELDARPVDRRRERRGHPARPRRGVDRHAARAPDRRGQGGERQRQPDADQDERQGVDGHHDVAGQLSHDGREQMEAGRVEQRAAPGEDVGRGELPRRGGAGPRDVRRQREVEDHVVLLRVGPQGPPPPAEPGQHADEDRAGRRHEPEHEGSAAAHPRAGRLRRPPPAPDDDPCGTDDRQDHRGGPEGDHAEAGPDEPRHDPGQRGDRDRRRRREREHPAGPADAERDQGAPARHQGDQQRGDDRDRAEDHGVLPSPEVTRLATGPDTTAEDTDSAGWSPRTGPSVGGAMVGPPG